MTGPANQQYQFAPSKPVNKMNSETQGNGNTTEPFYPTIPPPPEAAPQPSNHLYQPHPDFSNLQPPNFNSDSMLQVNNPNLGYPTSSPSDHQPFRPVPQEEAQNDSGPSDSRVWKSGDSRRFAPTSGEEGSNSDPSTSHAQPSGSSSQQNADSLPIARAQQKGSTYIPRVDRQHIGEAEHEQYKSKYAAEVRGLRSRIDDLWGGSAWFTQQIVPGYGRAGSHDRVLYTIQQLARGSPGEGGEGGTYPERVRQAIEDAVHARLAEENKNRKSKRENLNLRAVVTTNDFKAAAKALGCVSLRMPAGQPRKPRQPRQGNKAAAASTSKTPATNKNSNKGNNNNSASPSQSQSSSAEGSNWMQPVALTDPSVNHNHHQQQQLPIDYASQTSQIPPPSLPSNDDEVRANRAAFFAKYEADNRSRKTPNFMSDGGGLQPQGQGGSSPSYHSASSSRQLFTTLNTPQFGNYGQTNSWMNGSRDSNERWSGNQLSNSNTSQFGQNPSDRDQVYHSVPLARRPSMEMDGSQLGREAYQQQHLSNGGGMRPSSPSMYANSINGMVSNSNQNGNHLMRSIPSPSMSHPPTSLASHSLSQMSSPQMRNMNPGESSSNLNSGGRALPPLPSLSLPPLNWNPSPQQHHQQHHHQRKRGNEEEILHDDSRDPKRRMANQFQPASAHADSLHYA